MLKNLKVGLQSISEHNAGKLERIFQATGNRERSYVIASSSDHTDLLLVDIDNGGQLDNVNDIDAIDSEIPIVTIGRSERPEWSEYHIQGQLLATRVIRVLDQVKIPSRHAGELSASISAPKVACYPLIPDADSADKQHHAYAVLVVDDSELMRKAIELELNKASLPLSIEFADSGEQALAMVGTKIYDFIFLDVMMPGIDGYETCGQIRRRVEMKKIPIIMLSAKTSPLDEVKGVMAGCTNYITKPIKSDEFQNMLDRIMNWLSHYKKP